MENFVVLKEKSGYSVSSFSRKMDHPLSFHRGKWETSVLGVFTAHFCAERIQLKMLHHAENYNNFQGQLTAEKVQELLVGLKKQQSIISLSCEVSDAAVKS